MSERSAEPVEPPNDQRIPGLERGERLREHRPARIRARSLLEQHDVDAGSRHRVGLQRGRLIVGRHATIAEDFRSGLLRGRNHYRAGSTYLHIKGTLSFALIPRAQGL